MARLRPFWSYYGAKVMLAAAYPKPRYSTVIEPFAGSAGYSLLHHDRDVWLNDMDDHIAAVWRFLIDATPNDVLSLPLLEAGQSVHDIDIPDGARSLIGFLTNIAASQPKVTMPVSPSWGNSSYYWGVARRKLVASQVNAIKHWKFTQGSYMDLPDIEATWFIDPPYKGRAGSYYRHGSTAIDYDHLAQWCLSRKGQVIVCETEGADWLPFKRVSPLAGAVRKSIEVAWCRPPYDEGNVLDMFTGWEDDTE